MKRTLAVHTGEVGDSLLEPQGKQREVVYLKGKGHTVVLGTAGSGKTTMAVHRARYLADAPGFGGSTLLVTFNRALVTYLKAIGANSPKLRVENYHSFARGYLQYATQARVSVCGTKEALVDQALQEVRRATRRSVVDRPLKFFLDELHWMAGHGVVEQEAYLYDAQRVGRRKGLGVDDRRVVYEVYCRYLELRRKGGFCQDWDDMASNVLATLERDTSARRYRHVVVDEGQDFTPEMIRSLAAAIPAEGSLTFFGDYAQQIYGGQMSWRSLGLAVRKRVEFEQNYRNSRQIAQLAQAISERPHFRDEVDLVQPKAPTADGPKPTVVVRKDPADQIRQAATYANELAAAQQVAVLMRTRAHEQALKRHLGQVHGVNRLHKWLKAWPQGPGVFYGTYSAAKGLEFDSVILPLCDADELPQPAEIEAHGLEEAMAREARQLYVAVTRARSGVVILHSGAMTSLLPEEMSDLFLRLGS